MLIIGLCLAAVAAPVGCAVLCQTAAKHEAALQEETNTRQRGIFGKGSAKNGIAAAQRIDPQRLQAAQQEQAAALKAQRQKVLFCQMYDDIPVRTRAAFGAPSKLWNI